MTSKPIPNAIALLDAMARTDAKRVFIQGESDKLTYGAIVDRIARLVGLLRHLGLTPGMRIMLATHDDLAHATVFLALLRSGLTAVVLNPDARAAELATLFEAADPRAVVADAAVIGRIPQAQLKRLSVITLDAEEGGSFVQWLDAQPPAPGPASVDAESTAYILFTSGTTSRPKGVEITHRALFAQMATFIRQYGFDGRTRLMNLLPLHHTDGLTQGVTVAACAGATLLRPIRIRVNRVGDIVDACHDEKATHFIAVPSLLALMMNLPQRHHDALRTSRFRFVISTAAYLDPGLWQRFEETYGVRVVNVYGLTETVCETTYCGPDEGTRRLGTIGKPIDAEAMVVDMEGRQVPTGVEGELIVRGSHIMKGYFRMPEETAAVLQDGWLYTGDLATVDEQGFFRIVGRKKDVIISAGINVYPEDVNALLRTVPGIVDAATIGMADDRWGEVVVSGVVAKAGERPSDQQIASHFLSQASPEKLPREFHFFDELPRGPAGKVIKSELRRLIEERRATMPRSSSTGSMRERVLKVAAEAFKCRADDIAEDSSPATTPGWSSLAHVEFLMGLEAEFAFGLKPEEIMRIGTISDALALIERRTAG